MNNTVVKTYDILRLIAAEKQGMTLAQIVKALELPKSTVFNIVHSLEKLGMLSLTQGPVPVYKLGIEALRIGLAYLSETSLDSVARPVLSQLSRDTGETVFMSVRSGKTDLVYIMKFLSASEYQTTYSVGDVRPLLSLAMGKAMLAAMPDSEIASIMTPELFASCSIPVIHDLDSLMDYLHKTRELGYAIDLTSENIQLASPVAAPVLDMEGKLAGAISIVIMQNPNDPDRIRQLGRKANAAALKISKGLGYLKNSLF